MIKRIIRSLKRGTLIKGRIFNIKKKILINKKLNIKDPALYLEKYYNYMTKYFYLNEDKINLSNPITFNEKINWYKLNYKNDLMIQCSDKVKVYDYIKECGLDNILLKRYGVYNSLDEIDLSKLPEQFVLKNNSDSGGVFVCKDKSNFYKGAKKVYKKMKVDYSNEKLEWPYKYIEKKLLIEELINTKDGGSPNDYKFFCFNGEPKFLFVASERDANCKFDFYDINWNKLPVIQGHPNSKNGIDRPKKLIEMINICKILSKPFPFVRVDLYYENDTIYFGELTFYHYSGMTPFIPKKFDYIFGEYFDISNIDK